MRKRKKKSLIYVNTLRLHRSKKCGSVYYHFLNNKERKERKELNTLRSEISIQNFFHNAINMILFI